MVENEELEQDVQVPESEEERDLDEAVVAADSKQEKLEKELENVRKELAVSQDKYLRALADFENYKKRTIKERSELLKYQGENILADMICVVDDFERALEHVEADQEQFKSGVELIYKNFVNVFEKWGVKGESAVGQVFDPTKHNALSKVAVDDAQPGTVVGELKKAYFYKDRLLRAADVVVAEARPQPAMAEAAMPHVNLEDVRDDLEEE